ncbi:ribokinase [Meridianimarinicoccus sp. RP-17]|uniref:ribokinase n=1 Tax=Meridianimarinicoccus zhengii TaxID=2056810 RepID=UPI000DADBA31|nr:ribokinase [Phycocomes zhengii]
MPQTTARPAVTVFGSVNIDLTAYVPHLPRPGETAHATGHATGLGGKGANQAVAAARLARGPVRFVAAVGDDGFADLARAELARYGVGTGDLVTVAGEATGMALIHVDTDAQNVITVIAGANGTWNAAGPNPAVFAGNAVALFQLETPLTATGAALRAARAAGAVTILDPAPVPSADIGALIAAADIVTPNETEAEALTGIAPVDETSAFAAAAALLDRGAVTAVVKRGAAGLVWQARDGGRGVVPVFRVASVDTVAAGDCFNGALGAALAEGQKMDAALHFAAAAAALSTTRRGAAASIPSRDEVAALLA